jgi:hypothetical protein
MNISNERNSLILNSSCYNLSIDFWQQISEEGLGEAAYKIAQHSQGKQHILRCPTHCEKNDMDLDSNELNMI